MHQLWRSHDQPRLRPDRIILGEVRGPEAVTFLRAINTGHPGSFTTIHANTPAGALEQWALMAMRAGIGLTRADTLAYIRSLGVSAEAKVTHLGEDDGLFGAVDVGPGANSGEISDGPKGESVSAARLNGGSQAVNVCFSD